MTRREPDRHIVLTPEFIDRMPRHLDLKWIIGEDRYERVVIHHEPLTDDYYVNVYDYKPDA